jgi:hypothetical protein
VAGGGEELERKAHRLLYHSTLGLRVIKKKKRRGGGPEGGASQGHPLEDFVDYKTSMTMYSDPLAGG